MVSGSETELKRIGDAIYNNTKNVKNTTQNTTKIQHKYNTNTTQIQHKYNTSVAKNLRMFWFGRYEQVCIVRFMRLVQTGMSVRPQLSKYRAISLPYSLPWSVSSVSPAEY